jgi:endoglucanase
LLIVVDGLNFALDLTGVRTHPIKLSVADRLVYAAHDYYFAHPRSADYSSRAKLYGILDSRWGYLRSGPSTAPVWVSEFGAIAAYRANLESSKPSTPGYWFQAFLGYLKKYDYDWAFWPINGTQAWSVWRSRNQGDDEVHGILARNWKSARLPDDGKEPTVLTYLQNIQQSTPRTPVRLVAGVRARPALLAGTFAPCPRSAFGRA